MSLIDVDTELDVIVRVEIGSVPPLHIKNDGKKAIIPHLKSWDAVKKYHIKESPLSDDDWLDDYKPITPDILAWKFRKQFEGGIDMRFKDCDSAEKEDVVSFCFEYILSRLGTYDPKRGAQSNWINWKIRGAITEYKRTRNKDLSFVDLTSQTDHGSEDQMSITDNIVDSSSADMETEASDRITQARAINKIIEIARKTKLLKPRDEDDVILCLTPQKRKKLKTFISDFLENQEKYAEMNIDIDADTKTFLYIYVSRLE